MWGGVGLALLLLALTAQAASSAPTRAARVAAFPGGPHFIINCGLSHRNNDDPIVFTGHPGLSHNHTYVGNFSVDAQTTPQSLLGGRSSCDFEPDASAYWAPTLYVGRRAVLPLTSFVYYVKRTVAPVSPLPAGLKMIAGNSLARRSQAKTVASWGCGELGSGLRYAVIPACASKHLLELDVVFPSCWDGKNVDSIDHKRHMAYAAKGRCPASHPVAVPTIILILVYPEMPKRAQVASGRFAIHADFMNGWDQLELGSLVAELNSGS